MPPVDDRLPVARRVVVLGVRRVRPQGLHVPRIEHMAHPLVHLGAGDDPADTTRALRLRPDTERHHMAIGQAAANQGRRVIRLRAIEEQHPAVGRFVLHVGCGTQVDVLRVAPGVLSGNDLIEPIAAGHLRRPLRIENRGRDPVYVEPMRIAPHTLDHLRDTLRRHRRIRWRFERVVQNASGGRLARLDRLKPLTLTEQHRIFGRLRGVPERDRPTLTVSRLDHVAVDHVGHLVAVVALKPVLALVADHERRACALKTDR